MGSNTCPYGSLESFPVSIGFPLTQSSYRSATNHPLDIKFTWGVRSSIPAFSYAGSGEIDHVVNDASTSITYNKSLYTLGSVQLTSPTHANWIIPATLEVTRANNLEDIIFTYQLDTFTQNSPDDPKYIILVNPILRIDSSIGNPVYLTNLANSTAGSVTLEGLFPYQSGKNYVYYTTCVPGNTYQESYKNILVILNSQGSIVSNNLMTKIKTMYNNTSQGNYPKYIPLAGFMIPASAASRATGIEGFQNTKASVSNPATALTTTSPSTTQAFNSMKCVPFDPEKNLTKDGTIVIDTTSGTPFTLNPNISVAKKRDILGALTNLDGSPRFPNAMGLSDEDANAQYLQILPDSARVVSKNQFSMTHKGTIPFTNIEKTLAAFCGIIVLFIFIIVFVQFMGYVKRDVNWVAHLWPYIEFLVFNVGLFVGGFMLGYFTIPASCPTQFDNSNPKPILTPIGNPVPPTTFTDTTTVISTGSAGPAGPAGPAVLPTPTGYNAISTAIIGSTDDSNTDNSNGNSEDNVI
jgi:hypothetical protein